MVGETLVTPCVFAGDDESLVIEANQAVEILGPGRGTDHGEDACGVQPALALVVADDRNRLELISAVKGPHLAFLPDLDVGGGLDAIDEVAGHRRAQRTSHDEVDLTRIGGQVDHSLSGRVAAANHDHVLARGMEGLEMSGRVVETPALESFGSVGRQAAIVGADG